MLSLSYNIYEIFVIKPKLISSKKKTLFMTLLFNTAKAGEWKKDVQNLLSAKSNLKAQTAAGNHIMLKSCLIKLNYKQSKSIHCSYIKTKKKEEIQCFFGVAIHAINSWHLKSKFACWLCVQFFWHSHFSHFQIFIDHSQDYPFTVLTLKRVTFYFNKTIAAHYREAWTAKNYDGIRFVWNRIFGVLLFQFYHASFHPFFSLFNLIVAFFELFVFFIYAILFMHSAFFKFL